MVRTQIQLTEEQYESARKAAASQGISLAEYVRRSLDQSLAKDLGMEIRRLALDFAGSGRSGLSDLAEQHDRYLAEDRSR